MVTLIRTKLQTPVIDPDILTRTRLIERLEKGRHRKLTLISAPAGYGKSTLASILAKECSCTVAWLSLDEKDNDLGIFTSYLIAAVQTNFPDAFPETEGLLNGQQLPSLDILSTRLLNEAAQISQPSLLILDDYHVITNQVINQLVSTLIQYLPSNMHLALITRQDPPLDIVNLRARNQLTEIRLTDLRFSASEAEQYLDSKLGDQINRDQKQAIFERSEGWVVGLRLAVLVLRDRDDQSRLFESLQGTNQYIMAYLVSEVLAKQPTHVQNFLLQTSLLDRFCAPLGDAMLGLAEEPPHLRSQAIINRLEKESLFLIALDQHGEWFRYHHLFQDLLRHQLTIQLTEQEIGRLRRRAGAWLADQGFIEEALDHAFLAEDLDWAAEIVGQARFDLLQQTQWQRLEQLLRRFPSEAINSFPELVAAEMWLIYQHNQFVKLPAVFIRLENLISQYPDGEQQFAHLIGEASALKTLLLYYALDIEGVVVNAEQALELIDPQLGITRTLPRLTLAGVQQLAGNLNEAYTIIYQGFDDDRYQSDIEKAAILVTACFVSWIAADLTTLQQNAQQVIHLAQTPRSPGMLGFGHYFSGMAAYHQNDLAAAEEHFSYVVERPYATYDDSHVYSACGFGLTLQTLGRESEAQDVVDSTMAYLLATGNSEMVPTLQAFQAELALRQGQLGAAAQWAQRIDPIPPLLPMTQFYGPHKTLVKILLAENSESSLIKASGLLAQLREFLEFMHNDVHLIEVLALQALSQEKAGNDSAAMDLLHQALVLGLPGQFVRIFLDLGPVAGELLCRLPLDDPELDNYRNKITAATLATTGEVLSYVDRDNGGQSLVEPLTNRELEILSLLVQRETDKEIAAHLHISPHTVRTHTKNIYAKLGVNSRRQAALRAIELGLKP